MYGRGSTGFDYWLLFVRQVLHISIEEQAEQLRVLRLQTAMNQCIFLCITNCRHSDIVTQNLIIKCLAEQATMFQISPVIFSAEISRDVNFREFYFSIREFQISRLVEYSRFNAALGVDDALNV